MARILILAVVAILLFGGVIAADQMLQNPDIEPADADDRAEQENVAVVSGNLLEVGVVGLFALVVGALIGGVRLLGQ